MSGSNCCFLSCTQVSKGIGKMVWYSYLSKSFPQFVMVVRLFEFLWRKEDLARDTTSVQSSPVAQLYPTLCDPMNRGMPGLPVHHQLPESTQTHVHWVGDVIQPSHPLSSPSPLALNFSQHQGLFQWVSSLHQVAKVLEFQLQHQSFQWTSRTETTYKTLKKNVGFHWNTFHMIILKHMINT